MRLIKRKDGIDRCDITMAWYKVTKIFKGLLFLMIDTVNKAEELMKKERRWINISIEDGQFDFSGRTLLLFLDENFQEGGEL